MEKHQENIINCVCTLIFDDSIGQIAEFVYPEGVLEKYHLNEISALGFPETNLIKDDGDLFYIFKIRKSKCF